MQRLIPRARRWMAALIAIAWLATMAPPAAEADLVFYTARSSFDAAAPGLPVESFANANLNGQSYVTQPNGVSGATNDSVFALGSILPGITLGTVAPGDQSTALEVAGSGTGGKVVGTYWFQDTLVMTFAPGVSAVGEDVFGAAYPGTNFAGQVTENVYRGSTLLGSMNLNEAASSVGFLGATSTGSITSVTLFFNPTADVDSNTFVTNVAFGSPSVVPEPSSFMLSSLALALGGITFAATRRLARRPRWAAEKDPRSADLVDRL